MTDKQQPEKLIDFGYQQVPIEKKASLVASVFSSVAQKYDVMNDLMSMGVHRYWKQFALHMMDAKPGQKILDVAAGTADISRLAALYLKGEGEIYVTDINAAMLSVGRAKLIDAGLIENIFYTQADAEKIPFSAGFFDTVVIGFGLRNVTRKEDALRSFFRVLKPGGKLIILEFSKPILPILSKAYDRYSFSILPWLGKVIVQDEASYRYLAESIRQHPDQETLKNKMEEAGFEECEYFNLTGGIVALHLGYKF